MIEKITNKRIKIFYETANENCEELIERLINKDSGSILYLDFARGIEHEFKVGDPREAFDEFDAYINQWTNIDDEQDDVCIKKIKCTDGIVFTDGRIYSYRINSEDYEGSYQVAHEDTVYTWENDHKLRELAEL